MKVTKLLLCLILVASTFLTFGSTSSAATSFSDLGKSHRAYKEVTYLATGEIVAGNNGRFLPNNLVTRAEAVAMIGRALGLDGTKTSTSFKDVGSNNFASGYIQAASSKGIVSGYGDGTFRPNQNVTRGEMAVLISKAFNYSFGGTMSGAATALKSRGIAQGLSDGSFGAAKNIIRADYAIFLARAIDYTLRLNPTTSFSGTKYVNASSLNVRKGPSTKYAAVGSLARNATVQLSYSVGNWVLVKSGSITGFVNSSYLSSGSSSGESGTVDPSNPLSNLTIVIDPGHGGTDPGASGFGLKEKDVVLDTGLRLQKLLNQTPLNVKMTRSTDVFLELSERVTFAQNAKADAFVSIHANAFNGSASGSETYYYGRAATNPNIEKSKSLAGYIQERLVVAMGTKDRGVKHGDYHVLRENTMPAVLVELGFIDNASDNEKLASTTYRQKAAQAIYYGILDYYKANGYNVSQYY